jgi:hypothetical protein
MMYNFITPSFPGERKTNSGADFRGEGRLCSTEKGIRLDDWAVVGFYLYMTTRMSDDDDDG